MPFVRKLFTLALAALTVAPSTTFAEGAQKPDSAAIAAAVAQHVNQEDADRAAVRDALTRPDVRDIANRMGLDVDRASAMAGALAGDDLARAASAAREVNEQLFGGATVVITTTTIIIALLVIILLIVALK
jgi:hypothetical protein